MKYNKTVVLKDGRECVIRHGTKEDAKAALDNFVLTHNQTDYLLAYNDDLPLTVEDEAKYLQNKLDNENEVELLAIIDGKVVGLAGLNHNGQFYKLRHKVEFGINVDKDYWRLGIGRALTECCIDCAKKAGLKQIVLEVIGDNTNAISLYKSLGFKEYGRNPRGFQSKYSGWQEEVLMSLDLDQ